MEYCVLNFLGEKWIESILEYDCKMTKMWKRCEYFPDALDVNKKHSESVKLHNAAHSLGRIYF